MNESNNNSDTKTENILYAKSDLKTTLFIHTQNVIKRIIEVYDNLPLILKRIPGLEEAAIISATFHDIGKSHPEFQKILKKLNNEWEGRRHEIISAVIFAYGILHNWFRIQIPMKNINSSYLSNFFHNSFSNCYSEKNWFINIWLSILFHHKYLIQNVYRNSSQYLTKINHLQRIPLNGELRRIILLNDYYALKENYDQIFNLFKDLERFIGELRKTNKISLEFEFLKNNFPNEDNFFKDNIEISRFFQEYLSENTNNKDFDKLLIQDNQREIISPKNRFYGSILLALLKTADHMASMEIIPIKIPSLIDYKLDEYSLYSFQENVQKESRSVILRAPTGSGKTKAALSWAQTNQKENSRLFYVLPYQASLNAMFRRLSDYFNNGLQNSNSKIGISHSRNLEFLSTLFEENEFSQIDSELTPRQLKSLTKEIYFPIKVSTAHQLLRLSLFGKGWETLLLELQESLIVFDEIHTYEPRILGMIIGLMKILRKYNSKFIIMTATIPNFIIDIIKKEVFPNNKGDSFSMIELNENNPDDKNFLYRKCHKFFLYSEYLINFINNKTNLERIIDRYRNDFKQLFICNTVGSAQKLYDIFIDLTQFFDIDEILLFHSKFTHNDRQEIEKRLIESEQKTNKEYDKYIKILIATQVVEVSLDIDYDYGYFEAAPIDALIQRMGRINRRAKNNIEGSSEPNIIIFERAEHDKLIYNPQLVIKTLEYLKGIENTPLTEFDLQSIVESVYPSFQEEDLEEFNKGLHHELIDNHNDSMQIGLQKEWIFEIIENADKIIEFVPKEYLIQFEGHWKSKEYLEARKLLISCYYKREWKNNLVPIDNTNFLSFNHPKYQYDKKFGLRKI